MVSVTVSVRTSIFLQCDWEAHGSDRGKLSVAVAVSTNYSTSALRSNKSSEIKRIPREVANAVHPEIATIDMKPTVNEQNILSPGRTSPRQRGAASVM